MASLVKMNIDTFLTEICLKYLKQFKHILSLNRKRNFYDWSFIFLRHRQNEKISVSKCI